MDLEKFSHNTYGGYITEYSLSGSYKSMLNTAKEIISDWNFDKQCRANALFRDSKRLTKEDK